MTHEEIMSRIYVGKLVVGADALLAEEQLAALDKLFAYNALPPSQQAEKQALLREMFAEIGEDCYIETPFHANWGGKHVHFGSNIYANFNLTLVDDCPIYVGSHTMFGPNVTIAVAGHPVEPNLRRQAAQFNLTVRIGENVWIGCGRHHPTRRDHRRQYRHRRGQRGDPRHSSQRRRCRFSLPRPARDRGARPGILLQRHEN